MPTGVAKAAAALVVIDKLYAVQAAGGVARSGQAFVQIALTMFSYKAWRAGTRVSPYSIHALTTVTTAGLP